MCHGTCVEAERQLSGISFLLALCGCWGYKLCHQAECLRLLRHLSGCPTTTLNVYIDPQTNVDF